MVFRIQGFEQIPYRFVRCQLKAQKPVPSRQPEATSLGESFNFMPLLIHCSPCGVCLKQLCVRHIFGIHIWSHFSEITLVLIPGPEGKAARMLADLTAPRFLSRCAWLHRNLIYHHFPGVIFTESRIPSVSTPVHLHINSTLLWPQSPRTVQPQRWVWVCLIKTVFSLSSFLP